VNEQATLLGRRRNPATLVTKTLTLWFSASMLRRKILALNICRRECRCGSRHISRPACWSARCFKITHARECSMVIELDDIENTKFIIGTLSIRADRRRGIVILKAESPADLLEVQMPASEALKTALALVAAVDRLQKAVQ